MPTKQRRADVLSALVHPDSYDDVGEPTVDLDGVEAVEFASDFQLELSVPFTPEQLTAISRLAQERDIGPSEAAQLLVERALAARGAPSQ